MSKAMPPFINSPNFVMEVDNWHLTPNATKDEKEQFENWMSHKDIIFKREDEE